MRLTNGYVMDFASELHHEVTESIEDFLIMTNFMYMMDIFETQLQDEIEEVYYD